MSNYTLTTYIEQLNNGEKLLYPSSCILKSHDGDSYHRPQALYPDCLRELLTFLAMINYKQSKTNITRETLSVEKTFAAFWPE